MGRTTVTIEVRNYADVHAFEAGHISEKKIRKAKVEGIVDTGSARLVLPESVVKKLGLQVEGLSTVRYADHRKSTRDVVRDAEVRILNRRGVFHAVVEPKRKDALIGAIVMEDLDLLVDCVSQKLIPRDPHTLITEVE